MLGSSFEPDRRHRLVKCENYITSSVGDLYDRIPMTMPLNNPRGLRREQYADILAYILQFNGFPAGQNDLTARSEFLNEIRFEAPR